VGKKPDALEREIAERREAIGRRVEALQGRIEHDADTVKDEAKTMAKDAVEGAKRSASFDTKLRQHSVATLAGGFGVGMALGLATRA
jgi:hypothetical protein